ncbi:MAG TPA: protoporphyrinogen oxidase [Candidatus Marinimicrobia bacterium]|nr:protoporphyrinogen oxidase [Candidatus Neomarinimicrobiota bacterium]
MTKTIAIIGGGISGLTAAWKLHQAGFEITLLEAQKELGGAMRSIRKDAFIAETGPNTIMETSPKVTELLTELGLDSEKIYADSSAEKRYIIRNKKPFELPAGPGIFTTPLFSFLTKLALLREPFIPKWDNRHEESLADFVRRRLTQEFLDYAINPFVAGVFAGVPEQLSVKHAFPKLYALEQNYGSMIKGMIMGARERKRSAEKSKQTAKMFSFKNGIGTLPECITEKLKSFIQTGMKVLSVRQNGLAWEVKAETRNGIETMDFDLLLYAASAPGLSKLLVNGEVPAELAIFTDIYHPKVLTMTLGFHRNQVSHPLDAFGALVPQVENMQILGALFTSSLFPNRAPADHVTLDVFVGGSRQPELAAKPEAELLPIILRDLDTLLGVKGEPVFVSGTYWEKAIPQYDLGYGRYKEALNQMEAKYQGLFFTGNYRNGISAADSIKNASEIAEQIIEKYRGKNG